MQFLIVLGRVSSLAMAELEQLLPARSLGKVLRQIHEHVALIELNALEDAQTLQQLVGGSIKIAKSVSTIEGSKAEDLEKEAATILASLVPEGERRISFSIAEFGRDSIDALNLTTIKKLIQEKDLSARFVDAPRYGLSASVLLHQNVEEVVVVKHDQETFLGYTVAVQNIDDWTKRDRLKPAADRRRGMLPPKLARIMLNLASPSATNERILDPFCGTGTVLLEGLMMGKTMLGSDIRQEAVDQTTRNIAWFSKEYPGQYDTSVFVSDATRLTLKNVGGVQLDAIVAEGFLGPLTPSGDKLPNIFKGLEKLYLGAFKQWTQILKDGACICIVLPSVTSGKTTYSLSSLIDRLPEFGYNTALSPFTYDREDTIVRREIYILEYTKK